MKLHLPHGLRTALYVGFAAAATIGSTYATGALNDGTFTAVFDSLLSVISDDFSDAEFDAETPTAPRTEDFSAGGTISNRDYADYDLISVSGGTLQVDYSSEAGEGFTSGDVTVGGGANLLLNGQNALGYSEGQATDVRLAGSDGETLARMQLANQTALGSSSLSMGGHALMEPTAAGGTVNVVAAEDINVTSTNNHITTDMTLEAPLSVTVTKDAEGLGDLTISGKITASGDAAGLNISGDGELILSGAGSTLGDVTNNGNVVVAKSMNAASYDVTSAGSLKVEDGAVLTIDSLSNTESGMGLNVLSLWQAASGDTGLIVINGGIDAATQNCTSGGSSGVVRGRYLVDGDIRINAWSPQNEACEMSIFVYKHGLLHVTGDMELNTYNAITVNNGELMVDGVIRLGTLSDDAEARGMNIAGDDSLVTAKGILFGASGYRDRLAMNGGTLILGSEGLKTNADPNSAYRTDIELLGGTLVIGEGWSSDAAIDVTLGAVTIGADSTGAAVFEGDITFVGTVINQNSAVNDETTQGLVLRDSTLTLKEGSWLQLESERAEDGETAENGLHTYKYSLFRNEGDARLTLADGSVLVAGTQQYAVNADGTFEAANIYEINSGTEAYSSAVNAGAVALCVNDSGVLNLDTAEATMGIGVSGVAGITADIDAHLSGDIYTNELAEAPVSLVIDSEHAISISGNVNLSEGEGTLTVKGGMVHFGLPLAGGEVNAANTMKVGEIIVESGSTFRFYHGGDAVKVPVFQGADDAATNLTLNGGTFHMQAMGGTASVAMGTLSVSGDSALDGVYNGHMNFDSLTGSGKLTIAESIDAEWGRFVTTFDCLTDFNGELEVTDAKTSGAGMSEVTRTYINSAHQSGTNAVTIIGKTYSEGDFVMSGTGSLTLDAHESAGSFEVQGGKVTMTGDVTLNDGAGILSISKGEVHFGKPLSTDNVNATNTLKASEIVIGSECTFTFFHSGDEEGAPVFQGEDGAATNLTLNGGTFHMQAMGGSGTVAMGTLTVSGDSALDGVYNGRMDFDCLTGSGKLTIAESIDANWGGFVTTFASLTDFDGELEVKDASGLDSRVTRTYINSAHQSGTNAVTIIGKTYSEGDFVMSGTGSLTLDAHESAGSFEVQGGKVTMTGDATLNDGAGTLSISNGEVHFGNPLSTDNVNATNTLRASEIIIGENGKLTFYHAGDAEESPVFQGEDGAATNLTLNGGTFHMQAMGGSGTVAMGTLTVSGDSALDGVYNGRMDFDCLTGSGKLTIAESIDANWGGFVTTFASLTDFDGELEVKDASGLDSRVTRTYINSAHLSGTNAATIITGSGNSYSEGEFVKSGTGTLTLGGHIAEGSFAVNEGKVIVGTRLEVQGDSGTVRVADGSLVVEEGASFTAKGLELSAGSVSAAETLNVGTLSMTGGRMLLSDGITISGSEAVTLTNGTFATVTDITVGQAATLGNITIGGEEGYEGSLTFSGDVTLSGKVTQAGPGTLALNGAIYGHGGFDVTAGTLAIGNNEYSTTALETGDISLASGTTLSIIHSEGTFTAREAGESIRLANLAMTDATFCVKNIDEEPAAWHWGELQLATAGGESDKSRIWWYYNGCVNFSALTGSGNLDVDLYANMSGELGVMTFDSIRDYSGEIHVTTGGSGRCLFYINGADQSVGYEAVVSVNGESRSAEAFVKTGEGKLTLGKHTAEGSFTVAEGTLATMGKLTAESLTLSGGKLLLGGDVSTTSEDGFALSGGTLAASTNVTISGAAGSLGDITIGGEEGYEGDVTFSGDVTLTGKVTQAGPGTLALNGAIYGHGGIDVTAGTLAIGNNEYSTTALETGDISLASGTTLSIIHSEGTFTAREADESIRLANLAMTDATFCVRNIDEEPAAWHWGELQLATAGGESDKSRIWWYYNGRVNFSALTGSGNLDVDLYANGAGELGVMTFDSIRDYSGEIHVTTGGSGRCLFYINGADQSVGYEAVVSVNGESRSAEAFVKTGEGKLTLGKHTAEGSFTVAEGTLATMGKLTAESLTLSGGKLLLGGDVSTTGEDGMALVGGSLAASSDVTISGAATLSGVTLGGEEGYEGSMTFTGVATFANTITNNANLILKGSLSLAEGADFADGWMLNADKGVYALESGGLMGSWYYLVQGAEGSQLSLAASTIGSHTLVQEGNSASFFVADEGSAYYVLEGQRADYSTAHAQADTIHLANNAELTVAANTTVSGTIELAENASSSMEMGASSSLSSSSVELAEGAALAVSGSGTYVVDVAEGLASTTIGGNMGVIYDFSGSATAQGHSYSGDTTIVNGTVIAGDAAAFGSGAVCVENGVLLADAVSLGNTVTAGAMTISRAGDSAVAYTQVQVGADGLSSTAEGAALRGAHVSIAEGGSSAISGVSLAESALSINGTLTALGDLSVQSLELNGGKLLLGGGLDITGSESATFKGGMLAAASDVTIAQDVLLDGTTIGGEAGYTGNITFTGETTVASTLTNNGTLALEGGLVLAENHALVAEGLGGEYSEGVDGFETTRYYLVREGDASGSKLVTVAEGATVDGNVITTSGGNAYYETWGDTYHLNTSRSYGGDDAISTAETIIVNGVTLTIDDTVENASTLPSIVVQAGGTLGLDLLSNAAHRGMDITLNEGTLDLNSFRFGGDAGSSVRDTLRLVSPQGASESAYTENTILGDDTAFFSTVEGVGHLTVMQNALNAKTTTVYSTMSHTGDVTIIGKVDLGYYSKENSGWRISANIANTGDISFEGATTIVARNSTLANDGDIIIDAASSVTMEENASISNTGALRIEGGSLAVASDLVHSEVTMTGGSTLDLAYSLGNKASVQQGWTGTLTLGEGDHVIKGANTGIYSSVRGTGNLTFESTGIALDLHSTIQNVGSITLSGKKMDIGNGNSWGKAALIANTGAVNINASVFLRSGSIENDGDLCIAGGNLWVGTAYASNGVTKQYDYATIANKGNVLISAGGLQLSDHASLDLSGAAEGMGIVSVSGGSLVVEDGASFSTRGVDVSGTGSVQLEAATLAETVTAGAATIARAESEVTYNQVQVTAEGISRLAEGASLSGANISVAEGGAYAVSGVELADTRVTVAGTLTLDASALGGAMLGENTELQVEASGSIMTLNGAVGVFSGAHSVTLGSLSALGTEGDYTMLSTSQLSGLVLAGESSFTVNLGALAEQLTDDPMLGLVFSGLSIVEETPMTLSAAEGALAASLGKYFILDGPEGLTISKVVTDGENTILYVEKAAAVPEPATATLSLLALAALAARRRRR